MSKFAKFLRRLDLLAPDMTLNIGGENSVKTLFGSFLSLAYIGLVITVTVIQVRGYLDTKNPVAIFDSINISTSYEPFDLLAEKRVPIIFISDSYGRTVPFEYSKRAFDFWFSLEIVVLNNEGQIEVSEVRLPTVKCQQLIENGQFNPNYYKNMGILEKNITEALCFDTSNVTELIVQGNVVESPATVAYLELYPCHLEDVSQCLDKPTLNEMYIIFSFLEPNLDMSNKQNPLSYSLNSDFFVKLNTNAVNTVIHKLSSVTIVNDNGFLQAQNKVTSFAEIGKSYVYSGYRDEDNITCNIDENSFTDCPPYYQIQLQSSNSRKTITRTYKGILETLGEIGGLKELIQMAVFIFYMHYHSMMTKRTVVQKVFQIEAHYIPRVLCCKKSRVQDTSQSQKVKKNSEVSKQHVNEAYSRVESCLDVLRLATDLEALRFIIKVMWRESQRKDIPLLSFQTDQSCIDVYDYFCDPNKTETSLPPQFGGIGEPNSAMVAVGNNLNEARREDQANKAPRDFGRRVRREPKAMFTPDSFASFKISYYALEKELAENYKVAGVILKEVGIMKKRQNESFEHSRELNSSISRLN